MGGWAMIHLWNKWAIQILVVLSFSLQVVLLLLAGIRRREGPSVLRLVLWTAYQLADSTAIYAIGHLSLSSAQREQQLVAFWAPFLLLHLAGPDSITAYALEDNKLWKRHLLTVAVQVLGAAYVLYKHIAGNGPSVALAAGLMFAAGFLKYGERTWALQRGNMESMRSSLRRDPPARHYVEPEVDDLSQSQYKPHSQSQRGSLFGGDDDGDLALREEFLLRRAHSVFHICKRAAVDSSVVVDAGSSDEKLLSYEWRTMWRLVEMELSLMYDVVYTKAAVVHTWPGYCIRLFCPVAAAASFLLFWSSSGGHGSRVDVAITYGLLAGAFSMELASLLGALASSWTLAFLHGTRWSWLQHAVLCSGRWDRFRRACVVPLRRRAAVVTSLGGGGRRGWPGNMGQYNMLRMCSSRDRGGAAERLTQALGLGLEEWWHRRRYTWTAEVPEHVRELLYHYAAERSVNTMGVVRKRWGDAALEKHERLKWHLGAEIQEGILTWHIGTDIYLCLGGLRAEDAETARVVEAISNYMMFLLVDRPYMLPGLAQNMLYQATCDNIAEIWRRKGPAATTGSPPPPAGDDDEYRREQLARVLCENYRDIEYSLRHPRLFFAVQLAFELMAMEDDDPLQLALNVWLEILFYAANRCSRESHVKKLSSGGELTTILWLIAENRHYLRKNLQARDNK